MMRAMAWGLLGFAAGGLPGSPGRQPDAAGVEAQRQAHGPAGGTSRRPGDGFTRDAVGRRQDASLSGRLKPEGNPGGLGRLWGGHRTVGPPFSLS